MIIPGPRTFAVKNRSEGLEFLGSGEPVSLPQPELVNAFCTIPRTSLNAMLASTIRTLEGRRETMKSGDDLTPHRMILARTRGGCLVASSKPICNRRYVGFVYAEGVRQSYLGNCLVRIVVPPVYSPVSDNLTSGTTVLDC